MRLYECSVRYGKMQENGQEKKVNEVYLVNAITFTDAETRIVEQMMQYVSSELDVTAIKRTNYSEIVFDKFNLVSQVDGQVKKLTGENSNASEVADRWFKAKVNFITIDEKTLREKKQPVHFIINAGSINAAHDILVKHMNGTMIDYDIVTLDDTRIIDVFFYNDDKSIGIKQENMKMSVDNVIDRAFGEENSQQQ